MIKSIIPIPAFADNYIWTLTDSESNRACVVDPGDAQPVIDFLDANNLSLSQILITHHHPDHTGGIAQLKARYAPEVIGPQSSSIRGLTRMVTEDDEIAVFGNAFKVIAVPGHTLDHIAYFQATGTETSPVVFCGDTLFAAGCGRLFEGTPEQMHQSLAKLKSLPASTRIYCTHEYTLANLRFAEAADPENGRLLERIKSERAKRDSQQPTLPTSMQLELETNPFLRCREPALITSAGNKLGREPESETEVFAVLRRWKDNF